MEKIIKHDIEYLEGNNDIKVSLCIALWNMEYLLMRSIETYCKQDFPKNNFELIIISDNSEGDVQPILDYAKGKINYQFLSIFHDFGMRGNTSAFNLAFNVAKGDVIMETTAETMLPTDMIRRLYEPHLKEDRIFVAAKTYNLTCELQLKIDTVDWREDISNVMKLDGFFNDWTLNNFKNTHFGTHQTCSIKKKTFYEVFPDGYPLYGDYGSEDCRFSGMREHYKIKDITIMQPMAVHQWHPSWHFWGTMGKAPNCNKWGHSISNYLGDKSGEVKDGGSSMIWDGGSHEQYSEAEIADQRTWDDRVRATGCKVF